jgi:hypothetical protein
MNIRDNIFTVMLLVACLLLAPGQGAASESPAKLVRSGEPGFRTDIGIHLSVGGHSCLAGGSGYAKCKGEDNTWDGSFGLAGGLLVRPLRHFSFGLEAGFAQMRLHQQTANKWRDITVGPVARFHYPLRLRSLVLEPSAGLHFGYVRGIFSEKMSGSNQVDFVHDHQGMFFGFLLGADLFFLPRVAAGLEIRLIRTVYTEVCFESLSGVGCRAVSDEEVAAQYQVPGTETVLDGDMGVVDYPWKIFFGIHLLYYF